MEQKVLLPGWEIVRTIGSGGFGKVYEIRKAGEETGKYRSALKVISISQSPEEYKNYLDLRHLVFMEIIILNLLNFQFESVILK